MSPRVGCPLAVGGLPSVAGLPVLAAPPFRAGAAHRLLRAALRRAGRAGRRAAPARGGGGDRRGTRPGRNAGGRTGPGDPADTGTDARPRLDRAERGAVRGGDRGGDGGVGWLRCAVGGGRGRRARLLAGGDVAAGSEEHTSELQ